MQIYSKHLQELITLFEVNLMSLFLFFKNFCHMLILTQKVELANLFYLIYFCFIALLNSRQLRYKCILMLLKLRNISKNQVLKIYLN